jgi:class 3 adenylate cyclase
MRQTSPMKERSTLRRVQETGIARFTLRFSDPVVERQFREFDNRAAVGRALFCLLMFFGISVPFLYVDELIHPERVDLLLGLRVVGTLALLGIAALCKWWASTYRFIQFVACGGVTIYSWVTILAVLIPGVPRDYARVGTVLLMLGLIGIVRIRFRPALWASAATLPGVTYVLLLKRDSWASAMFEIISALAYSVLILTIAFVLERSKRQQYLANRDLELERQRSDDLLHNILPEPIAQRLRDNPTAIAESVDAATVLFSDIVGFTPFSESLEPSEVLELLDTLFGKFDDLCADRGIEKIKTIGDAYMAVAGIPRPDIDHAASIVELALDMQRAASAIAPLWPNELMLRIGISSGPVVAGVIGHRKFAYDLWGDTVNTASRMESQGRPNRIHVSSSTYDLLRDRYAFGEPQQMEIKGKGQMTTYYLLGPDLY